MSAPDPVLVERMRSALGDFPAEYGAPDAMAAEVAEVHAAEQVTAAVKAERQRITDAIDERTPHIGGALVRDSLTTIRAIVNGGDE